jgi:hypothetical protein
MMQDYITLEKAPMPPVCFTRTCPCDPAQGGTMNFPSDEPIPCSGESFPCFSSEQGIASKALGLLAEMASGRPKTVKKGQNLQNSLFSLFSAASRKGCTPVTSLRLRREVVDVLVDRRAALLREQGAFSLLRDDRARRPRDWRSQGGTSR